METAPRFRSFAEFWPFYLDEHRKETTRLLHVTGTLLAIVTVLIALVAGHPLWLLLAPILGYGFAWISHAFVERNRPATFTYPLWSLFGDFRMLGLWLSGRLASEIAQRQSAGK